jgi:hypothetical protein
MTLESAAAAKLVLMVWCKGCGHLTELDPAELVWTRDTRARMASEARLLAMRQP